MPGAITVITIASVIVVTLSQLHPSLLFTNTTTTGGDTGAHIAMPKYLETLLRHGHLTGWDPGWYDGFPLYTFYFTLPDLFIAIGGWIIPYDVAFKMGTILGSVMLPVCAWACGRFFRLRPPLPTLLAAATLPFLFDYTFTIYGGNLFSTLAGEYAFSFSLSLAILFLGLFACAVREGRYRGLGGGRAGRLRALAHRPGHVRAGRRRHPDDRRAAARPLGHCRLAARWSGADDDAVRPVPRARTLWWAASTVGIGLLLSGWWLVPFGLEHAYTTSMGYQNVEGWGQYFREADTWALVLAGLGRHHRVPRAQPLRHHGDRARYRVGACHGTRPTRQPLQRASPAAVVHLGLPHGGLGVRDGLHRRRASGGGGRETGVGRLPRRRHRGPTAPSLTPWEDDGRAG